MGRGRSRARRVGRALLLALAVLSIVPAAAFAHPLGNFTINHFAGIRIGSDRIDLDVVIDRAEIPTFQERQRLDTNGDGTLAPAEIEAERQVACQALSSDLALTVAGRRVGLDVATAGLSFPPGAGGLSTMRLVCEYTAASGVATEASAGTAITFEDRSFGERIGWREIVLLEDGVTLAGASAGTEPGGVSQRLTVYPTDLLSQPLDERSTSVTAVAGGPALPAWTASDASPLAADGTSSGAAGSGVAGVGAVPGGVAPELAAIIDAGGLEPGVLLASLLVALVLGATHAVSPGHGKTIMAAYLVGTRGTARHAIGLGLTVTISHTLGVLALAGVTLLAADVLPPDRLYPILQVASGALVIVIGGRLLISRLRAVLAERATHDHDHDHESAHESHSASGAATADPAGMPRPHVHSHGGRAHSHAPADGASLSWRSLFALGLSGGLVPSASALILLLGSIAAGHVAYGVVLVLAFGIGMALVLGGVGLALVRASRLVERLPRRWSLGRLAGAVQLATAGLVVILGLVLTSQALTTVL